MCSGHLQYILTRHPDLITTLCFRKTTMKRRKNRAISIRFGNAILEALARSGKTLFTCLECRGLLDYPVTLECGHTFCEKCTPTPGKRCLDCGAKIQNGDGGAVNVLLRDLVNKLKEQTCDQGKLLLTYYETNIWQHKFKHLLMNK